MLKTLLIRSSECNCAYRTRLKLCNPRTLKFYSNPANKVEDSEAKPFPVKTVDFPPERIRNFSIIAHIDHGKSTLADRMLEMTGTIVKSEDNKQILDKLQVERERGITVKAQTATMLYEMNGVPYILNLIDTPGHVDFSYEVARSLSACQGVILLVDANQGVQAQTVANFYLAFGRDLTIIPALNKIDLKNADPEKVLAQLETLFEMDKEKVLKISAKMGIGINSLFKSIIKNIPPPSGDRKLPTKALLFDSWYDKYKGVSLLVSLKDGKLYKGQNITLAHTGKSYEIKEIGVLFPNPTPLDALYAGQVGYVFCNMRTTKEAHIGDTIFETLKTVEPLPGFKKAKPMVFSGVYPMDQSEHPQLRSALEKLLLNDPSVECVVESSPALGNGWRLGFLGVLHLEVFSQRLEQEYGAQVVLTCPSVPIKVKVHGAKNIKKYGPDTFLVNNPVNMPDRTIISEMMELFVNGTIITPDVYTRDITSLCMERRGVQTNMKQIDSDRVLLNFKLPLNEIVVDFYDKLKSITSGYASFDYEEMGFEISEMVKLDVLLNGIVVDEMSSIAHFSKAREVGKFIVTKLKDTIARHQFQISIQAAVGSHIMAREDIRALRKDVTAKLYGGDVTRRQKLLKRQAEGKQRMKLIGKIEIPRETFIKILQR